MPKKKNNSEIDLTPGHPCSVKGWCPAMKLVLDSDMNQPSGFTMAHMFSLSGGPTRSILVYKSRKKNSPNLALTVCPWCKSELAPICNPPKKVRAKKETKVDEG